MMSDPSHYHAIIECPIGKLGIRTSNNQLSAIEFLNNDAFDLPPQCNTSYFANPKFQFTLPYATQSSEFQNRVLREIGRIPTGQIETYGEIASRLKTSARAIGMACRHNAIPIIIPCHRVIAKTHIGGYSGAKSGTLITIKNWLLKHEAP